MRTKTSLLWQHLKHSMASKHLRIYSTFDFPILSQNEEKLCFLKGAGAATFCVDGPEFACLSLSVSSLLSHHALSLQVLA